MTYPIGWRGKTENVENRNVIKIEKKHVYSGSKVSIWKLLETCQNGFFGQIFRKIKIFLNLPKNKTEMRVRYILSICILEYTRVFNQNQKFCGAEIFDQNLESFFWLWVMDKLVFGTWENMHHLLSRFLFLKIEPEVGNGPKILSEMLTFIENRHF